MIFYIADLQEICYHPYGLPLWVCTIWESELFYGSLGSRSPNVTIFNCNYLSVLIGSKGLSIPLPGSHLTWVKAHENNNIGNVSHIKAVFAIIKDTLLLYTLYRKVIKYYNEFHTFVQYCCHFISRFRLLRTTPHHMMIRWQRWHLCLSNYNDILHSSHTNQQSTFN